MRFSSRSAHSPGMPAVLPRAATPPPASPSSRVAQGDSPTPVPARPSDDAFAGLYRRHYRDCCRWLRAMGAPDAEVEDLAQEVFVVAHRALEREPLRNERAWLYQTALRTFSDHRRRSWWRHLFHRRAELPAQLAAGGRSAVEIVEARELARLGNELLGRLSREQRSALVLFEIEGLSGEEIATLEGIPLKTVWSRLLAARKRFAALAGKAARRGQEWQR